MKLKLCITFTLLFMFYACSDPKSFSEKDLIYEQVYTELKNTGMKIEDRDTIYYIESSACLSCEEKFWLYYKTSKRPLKVIRQTDNSRTTVSQVIPDIINMNQNIFLHHSDKMSRLLDALGRDRTGVFIIIMGKNNVKSVNLFMD